MKVHRIIFKQGANIFDSTMGGTVYFAGPKAVGQNALVSATLRPDLGGVLLERPPFEPHLIPFDNLLDVGLAATPRGVATDAPVNVATTPPAEPLVVDKRGPGRPPKIAAAMALALSFLAAPAFAGDASTDAKVSQTSTPVTLCVTAEAQWETPKGTVKPKGVKCPAAFPRQDTMQIRAPGNVVVLSAICCPPQPPKAVK